MGNQSVTQVVFENIIKENETIALLYIQNGFNIISQSNCGVSVLRASLEKGLFSIFKYCYNKDAEMSPPLPYHQTSLHRAVCLNHYNFCVGLLKEKNLLKNKIDTQDDLGRTALHIAVENGNPDIVALLLKYNANKSLKNHSQKTPYDLALDSLSINAIEIIEQLTIEDHISNAYDTKIETLNKTEFFINFNHEDRFVQVFQKLLKEHKICMIEKNELNTIKVINKGSSCLVFQGT